MKKIHIESITEDKKNRWKAVRAAWTVTSTGKAPRLSDIAELSGRAPAGQWSKVSIASVEAAMLADGYVLVDDAAEKREERDDAADEASEAGVYPSADPEADDLIPQADGKVATLPIDCTAALMGRSLTFEETETLDVRAMVRYEARRMAEKDPSSADPDSWSGGRQNTMVRSIFGLRPDSDDGGAVRTGLVRFDPYVGGEDPADNLRLLGENAETIIVQTEDGPRPVWRPRYGVTEGPSIKVSALRKAASVYAADSGRAPDASALKARSFLALSGDSKDPSLSSWVTFEDAAAWLAAVGCAPVNAGLADRLVVPTVSADHSARFGYEAAKKAAAAVEGIKSRHASLLANGVKVKEGSLMDAARRGEDGIYLLESLRNSGYGELADAVETYGKVSAGDKAQIVADD